MNTLTTTSGRRLDVVGTLAHPGRVRLLIVQDEAHERFVLKLQDVATPRRRERLLREAYLQRRLAHPGICPVVDLVETVEGLGIVTPLIHGPTLRTLLNTTGGLELDEGLWIFYELAQALAVAHARQVVHRDLKPSNILMDVSAEHLRPVLIDFGIAKVPESDVTLDDTVLGTPGYMAPEQIDHRHPVEGAADVFALATVAVHVLTGERTFAARDVSGHYRLATSRGYRELPGEWPPGLTSLVHAMLSPSPTERPQGASEVVDTLRPLVVEGPPFTLRVEGATWWMAKGMVETPSAEARTPTPPKVALPVRRKSTLPKPAGTLVGREVECQAILSRLQQDQLVVLVGQPGIGKTQVALHVGRDSVGRFPDAGVFVDASSALDPLEAMQGALGADRADVPCLAAELESLGGALVVVDGVHEIAPFLPALVSITQAAPRAAILVTARRATQAEQHSFALLPLPLDDDEETTALARALLRERPDAGELDDRSVREHLRRCGGHPGRFLATVGLPQPTVTETPEDLVEWISSFPADVLEVAASVACFSSPPSIDSVADILGIDSQQAWDRSERAAVAGLLRVGVRRGAPAIELDRWMIDAVAAVTCDISERVCARHVQWLVRQAEAGRPRNDLIDEVLRAAERIPDEGLPTLLPALTYVLPAAADRGTACVRIDLLANRLATQPVPRLAKARFELSLADLHLSTGGPAGAQALIERWRDEELPRELSSRWKSTAGFALAMSGHNEQAIELLRVAHLGIDETHHRVVAVVRLAQVLVAAGDNADAVRVLRELLPKVQEPVLAARLRGVLGTCAADARDEDLAIELLFQAAKDFRRAREVRLEAWALLTAAKVLNIVGQSHLIEPQLDRLTEIMPTFLAPSLHAYHTTVRAEYHLAKGSPATALFELDAFVRQTPVLPTRPSGPLLTLRAEALLHIGDAASAWPAAQQAVAAQPPASRSQTESLVLVAVVALTQGRSDAFASITAARNSLRKISGVRPELHELVRLAWARATAGQAPPTPNLDTLQRRCPFPPLAVRLWAWVERMPIGSLLDELDPARFSEVPDDDFVEDASDMDTAPLD